MPFTIAFYVHHHGSGHLMRTMQIVKALPDYKIILFGSALQTVNLAGLLNVALIHLPLDFDDVNIDEEPDDTLPETFHYAPLNVPGIKNRMAIMANVFEKESPMILVVDVSVEITLFARLCGIPTIVMAQHGKRNDLPHLMAFQSAALILAPFSESLYVGERNWVYDKTLFTGGFSRFIPDGSHEMKENEIAILIGAGGTSINANFIKHIAQQSPTLTFHVIGEERHDDENTNIFWHGRVDHPQALLDSVSIIIGNTGHNTVMEVATLNKRFIGIPESRPFAEQEQKAEAVAGRRGIYIVSRADLWRTKWQDIFEQIIQEEPDWSDVILPNAIDNLAKAIVNTANKFFKS